VVEKGVMMMQKGPISYKLYDYSLYQNNKSYRFYCDYPEGFETEDLLQVIKIMTDEKQEDPMKVLRMIYPQYHFQVTFCEDGDIVTHIVSKSKDDLVKYLRCTDIV
jgi:hypothetical protein